MEASTCVPSSVAKHGLKSLLVLLTAMSLLATEKYEIAKNADLVVVGQLRKTLSFPWFDGWRFSGSIHVDEVLSGTALPGQELSYRFVCSCCPIWPKPAVELVANQKGLWFLDRRNGRS